MTRMPLFMSGRMFLVVIKTATYNMLLLPDISVSSSLSGFCIYYLMLSKETGLSSQLQSPPTSEVALFTCCCGLDRSRAPSTGS